MQMITRASFAQFSRIRNCQPRNSKCEFESKCSVGSLLGAFSPNLFHTFLHFYFSFFSIVVNASTKSSSCVALLLRFVSPRDSRDEKYGGTEESFSSEKCLRGANVFSVSVRHISLPGPELASVLIFYWLQCYLLSARCARCVESGPGSGPASADTEPWSHSAQAHNIIQPTTLLCITKY